MTYRNLQVLRSWKQQTKDEERSRAEAVQGTISDKEFAVIEQTYETECMPKKLTANGPIARNTVDLPCQAAEGD
jgi:hypothetical protein